MQVRDIIIAVFVFSGIMIGSGIFFNGLADQYSVTPSKNLRVFNYTGDMYDSLGLSEAKIQEIRSQGLGVDDIAGWFVLGALEAVKTFLTLPVGLSAMVSDITVSLGFDPWVFNMIFGIIITTVIFAIIYAAVKVRV